MTESTLSITYDQLAVTIAVFLGYSPTDTDWTDAQVAELDRYIQAGIRQFYYPPAGEGVPIGYEWSFLKPTTTVTTLERYATGSLAVVGGTCTLSDGTWPSWAATHGTLVIDDTEYAITTRGSDTELTVVGDDTTADEDDWYLSHAGYQDLPDDLGRVIGNFYYSSSDYRSPVVQMSEFQILAALSRTTSESAPKTCNVRHKTQVAGAGQRLEVLWFPIPDSAYTLEYVYEAYSGAISTEDNPYPLGGMKYAELVTESCLAKAEQRANDEQGLHTVEFLRLLVAGIAHDKKQGATYYGPMSPVETNPHPRHGDTGSSYPITYDGETW